MEDAVNLGRAGLKISRLTLTNHSGRARRLSVTAYVEWVLGPSRAATAPFVVTEIEPRTGAMLARNAWGRHFAARVAFVDLAGCITPCNPAGCPDHAVFNSSACSQEGLAC